MEKSTFSSSTISPQALPQNILQIAMEWQVTLWSGEVTPQEHRAFNEWLQADQQHQLAWQQVQQVNRQLGGVPDQLAGHVLRQTAAQTLNRRRVLLNLGVMTGIGIVGFGATRTAHWQSAMADYCTARGERSNITLPDGTQLILNTASAVDVNFNVDARRLILHRGEIQITTGSDSGNKNSRPFSVQTSAGIVRPIGTQFTVRQFDHGVQVQVTEGAVELHSHQGSMTRLDAGQQTLFNRQGAAAIQVADHATDAWTRGLLIAEQQKLGDFIADVGRYHPGVLRCDPAVADLIISGVYPLKDTHAILRALEHALPVRVNTLLGYWTTVGSTR